MNLVWTLAKKELRCNFNSPLAYIFLIVFLVVPAFFFFRGFFLIGQVEVRTFLSLISSFYLFLIPAITMRTWAEEKRSATLELLLTSPIKEEELVLGKFMSAFLFLLIGLLLSLIVPLIVSYTGELDWGVVFASYVGLLFLGGAYLSLSMWVSAYTDNQIIAFIASLVVCFLFYIIGQTGFLYTAPKFLVPVFQFVGLSPHFESIARGVLDSRDILFYLSFIGFFLFLNVRYIAGRRFQ